VGGERGALSTRPAGRAAAAFVAAVLAGWVALSAVTIAIGLLTTEVVLASDGARTTDDRVAIWLAARRTGFLNDVTAVVSDIGDVYVLAPLVALTAVLLAVRKGWIVAAIVVAAPIIESAVYRTTTLVVERPRPAVHRLERLPPDASYPSGHTAASVAVYGAIALLLSAHLRRRRSRVAVWAVALGLAALVAFARVYRGMHHPLDVAAGALVGAGALVVSVLAARAAGHVRSGSDRAGSDA
jgi:undecaprenyl-diphosphatase